MVKLFRVREHHITADVNVMRLETNLADDVGDDHGQTWLVACGYFLRELLDMDGPEQVALQSSSLILESHVQTKDEVAHHLRVLQLWL